MARRFLLLALAATFATGCLPDLGPWRVLRPGQDGGPRRDAGRGALDAGGPYVPCQETLPLSGTYTEGFESGPGGWRVVGEFSSWELGMPTAEFINAAGEGQNAWVVNLDGEYQANEETYVYSPCFNASTSTGDLIIELQRTYHTESTIDRATLEVSLDAGMTWERVVGSANDGWYSGSGWGGMQPWAPGSTVIPGTAGQPRVLLRMVWRTDGSVQREGFGFDDVRITTSSSDLAVRVEQGDECGMAVVTVSNVGGVAFPDGFELTTVVDGAEQITTYDQAVEFRDEVAFEFGAALARTLEARIFHVNDGNTANNQASYTVVSLPASSFFRDFEADDGGLTVTGTNSSWEWGAPAGTLIAAAASGQRAWVTNLSGDHNTNERSFLYTPCIDMRGLTRDAQLSLEQIYRSEMNSDYLRVEASVDGGSFRNVGSPSSGGTNWYDSFNGWSGASGGASWRTAQHPLTGTMGSEFVRLRFRFNSDANTENEGFGIDDLQIVP